MHRARAKHLEWKLVFGIVMIGICFFAFNMVKTSFVIIDSVKENLEGTISDSSSLEEFYETNGLK